MPKQTKKKLIVILGPTSAGKSDLGVKLALWLNLKQNRRQFNIEGAEIISADSRQVYKKMDLGTGKITKKEMRGIPHRLLDVASPKRRFTVGQYQKLAEQFINKILKNKKVPFLVGGSPFYLYSIVDGWQFPKLKPDWQLRKKLEKEPAEKLFKILKKIDSRRAKNIDKSNKRRLVRAIEIAQALGKVPKIKKRPKHDCLLIGIKKKPEILKRLIQKRLLKRLKAGMVKEVENLRKDGISFKKLEEFGLEYRWIARYLQKKISKEEMIKFLEKDIQNFVRRQMTWFKKDKRIHWIQTHKEAKKLIKQFLRNLQGSGLCKIQ